MERVIRLVCRIFVDEHPHLLTVLTEDVQEVLSVGVLKLFPPWKLKDATPLELYVWAYLHTGICRCAEDRICA